MRAPVSLGMLAVAAIAIAWGGHDLFQAGECGTEISEACPSGHAWAFGACFLGFTVLVTSIVTSGSARFLTAAVGLLTTAMGVSMLWSQLGTATVPGAEPNWIVVGGGAAILLVIGLPGMLASTKIDAEAAAQGAGGGDGFWTFDVAASTDGDGGSGCSSGCGGGCGGGD